MDLAVPGDYETQNFSSFMVDFFINENFALLLVKHFSQLLGMYLFL